MGKKRVSLTSGKINQRQAGPSLRSKIDREFDDFTDGKTEYPEAFRVIKRDRNARGGTKRNPKIPIRSVNSQPKHDIRLRANGREFYLECSCGWRSDLATRGRKLPANAKDLHLSAYQ